MPLNNHEKPCNTPAKSVAPTPSRRPKITSIVNCSKALSLRFSQWDMRGRDTGKKARC
jgi:hypothetical protein